ncbi:unnamed protein product [Calicophoron daubneyi]|uniref:Uncharacterized protein n=1 Tax=Calicophoron daubneyi TaxID=300641 RepID=A0AAV2TA18_CALDB
MEVANASTCPPTIYCEMTVPALELVVRISICKLRSLRNSLQPISAVPMSRFCTKPGPIPIGSQSLIGSNHTPTDTGSSFQARPRGPQHSPGNRLLKSLMITQLARKARSLLLSQHMTPKNGEKPPPPETPSPTPSTPPPPPEMPPASGITTVVSEMEQETFTIATNTQISEPIAELDRHTDLDRKRHSSSDTETDPLPLKRQCSRDFSGQSVTSPDCSPSESSFTQSGAFHSVTFQTSNYPDAQFTSCESRNLDSDSPSVLPLIQRLSPDQTSRFASIKNTPMVVGSRTTENSSAYHYNTPAVVNICDKIVYPTPPSRSVSMVPPPPLTCRLVWSVI